ncbi:aldo-keto reductase Mvan_2161-like [Corticium candelabrum]|uniref:aldo-keto reductase Mvan_2161-like n=1 Tax=Corticium candelabrum TaxID=121492 RepID=UPI002E266F76|nr:aldo-keto reductase Mvan_2161-like [Corticium candelabrum]
MTCHRLLAGFVLTSLFQVSIQTNVVPSVLLQNSATNNVLMPATGLGTGGYALTLDSHGEYWNDSIAEKSVSLWLKLGGRRIDGSFSYMDQVGIGRAIKASGIPRKEIFITSKVGPGGANKNGVQLGGPLGYNDSLKQMEQVLGSLGVTYVDLLLIHWPYDAIHAPSSEKECNGNTSTEMRLCRQSTWKAMLQILKEGKARAVGVSNFALQHLQDIIDMGEMIPSVNQCEFHVFWHDLELLEFCKRHNITFNGYSPLGTPDFGPWSLGWNESLLELPLVKLISQRYGKTAAQILQRYSLHQGVLVNPRSWNEEHMRENLNVFDFELSDQEVMQLNALSTSKKPNVCPDPKKLP